MSPEVYFQAHRGSVEEAPENTLAAFRHAWDIPGAVPEADLRTARDGAVICLHDATLARTTDAPEEIGKIDVSELNLEEIRRWDAGARFSSRFADEKVPTLAEVVEEMQRAPGRQLYLDFKHVDLTVLEDFIGERERVGRLILVHGEPRVLLPFTRIFPGIRTMTWLSGTPDRIRRRFAELAAADFPGITHLQMHLQMEQTHSGIRYSLETGFLTAAHVRLRESGRHLRVRPFAFDALSLRVLLDIGIRWFVADAPARFATCLAEARKLL